METKSSYVFPLVFGYFLGTSFAATCYDADPSGICGANITFIPNLSTRGPSTVVTEELFQWKYCDVYAIDRGQWYHSNTPMTTTCPDMYMCGTKFPIWLQGQSPVRNGGIVNTTACLRDFDTCCLRTYNIAAVNCGNTLAYCFNELPSGCHQRYCFDEYFTENTLLTTPGTTLQTTLGPTLQTTPDTTLQTTPEATLQTTPETILQTTPKTTLQITPETTPRTTPVTTLQTTPKTTLKKTPDTTPRTTPETPLETIPETTQQTTELVKTNANEPETTMSSEEMESIEVLTTFGPSTMQSSSTAQAQQMERKDSDTIIILVACLCVLLSVVIVLMVVIIRRRRAKQSKTSDKSLDKPDADEWIPKTMVIGRDQVLGEQVHYESLKNLDKTDFLGAGYASLKQHDGCESERNMEYLRQHEVIFYARLSAINKLYEGSANVSEDYEIPNPTMEEDHYQTLP